MANNSRLESIVNSIRIEEGKIVSMPTGLHNVQNGSLYFSILSSPEKLKEGHVEIGVRNNNGNSYAVPQGAGYVGYAIRHGKLLLLFGKLDSDKVLGEYRFDTYNISGKDYFVYAGHQLFSETDAPLFSCMQCPPCNREGYCRK